ncbi:MAG: sensor histidine kinase [Spirochaetales bacterium]|nr:sensor histidine kinase [Spirochaetales bacterium]
MASAESAASPSLQKRNPLALIIAKVRSLKIGQKLVAIYVLGIFLPLAITNGLVLRSVLREASQKEHEYMLSKVGSIMDSIVREFEPLVDVTSFVYTDSSIYRILADEYAAFTDFLNIYTDYLLPATMKYVNVFPGISRMIIYTENEMVGTSGLYMSINAYVRQTLWYRQLARHTSGIFTIAHVDRDTRMDAADKRYISMFRDLNNLSYLRRGRLVLRLDINHGIIERHLSAMGYDGNIRMQDLNGAVIAAYSNDGTQKEYFSFDVPFSGMRALEGCRLIGSFTRPAVDVVWSSRWTRLLGISGLSIAFASLFILLLSRSITRRLAKLSDHMKKVKHEDFSPIDFPGEFQDEVGQLINDYNIMAGKIDELINNGYKMEIERGRLLLERRQAEMNALQSQVNPHFLYNTLESIRMKSHIKGEHETAAIIKRLSKMFRRMTGWDEDMIPLEEELAFTREYLDIQHYRFGPRFSSEFFIDPATAQVCIPKLMVQALVENACAHGIECKEEGGTVRVSAVLLDGSLQIKVRDDGAGCDAGKVIKAMLDERYDARHTGLANVYRRLKLHFGDRVSISFTSTVNEGTEVTIVIRLDHETP